MEGAEAFDWEGKQELSGRRVGSKATGIGLGLSPFTAGSRGYDGLLVIRPDGRPVCLLGRGEPRDAFDRRHRAAGRPTTRARLGPGGSHLG